MCGSELVECLWFAGEYDLYLIHAHIRETMRIRYSNDTYLCTGQALTNLPSLANITFASDDRQIAWDYDGMRLHWTYAPPLSQGDELTLTREWDQLLEPDSEGFRALRILDRTTSDSQLCLRVHDVDIIDSSLPLDLDYCYSGNLSGEQFVTYSSRFRLYRYDWHCSLFNGGTDRSEVSFNVSIPRDGGFQHVLNGSMSGNMEDGPADGQARMELSLGPGLSDQLGIDLTVLTQTWDPELSLDLPSPVGDMARYLSPHGRFWQANDPRIQGFALSATNGVGEGMDKIRALATAVDDHLNYVVTNERMGALWAYINQRGSCMEHSDLFIACARSLGIPSLYVSGLVGSGSDGDVGHAWVAVWLPEVGWFGLDPTWPSARCMDSGRLVISFANPDDIGVSWGFVGGNVTLSEWGETWRYEELTASEAGMLLGIREAAFTTACCIHFLLWLLGRHRDNLNG